jgi:hypothetical protein
MKLGQNHTVAAGGEMIVNTEWGGFNNSVHQLLLSHPLITHGEL